MGTHLDGTVPEVGDLHFDGRSVRVEQDRFAPEDVFPGRRRGIGRDGVGQGGRIPVGRRDAVQSRAVQGPLAFFRADGMMHGHQLDAVGKRAFDLHLVHHFCHRGQHLAAPQDALALVHQHRDAFAFADEFEQLRRD